MTRDLITPVIGVENGQIAEGAGTAINTTNGGNVVLPTGAVGNTDRLVLRIDNTTVSAKNVTIRAGVYPPAFRSSMGDLVLQVALSAKAYFFIESARFIQADGSVNLDYESGMTGTVFALITPNEFVG